MVRLICGIQRRDGGVVDRGLVEAMLAAMNREDKPRATDVVVEGPVGLGILELASAPSAPLGAPRIVETGAGWLTADARLYDRESLGSLAPEGAEDADVLAAALDAWGWRAPARLHGDFAYAHWDRATGAIELARDHFGVRPLQYVHRRGAYLAFASLPGALLRTGLATRELDVEALRHYHYSAYAPEERTFYHQVKSALAAHVVRFEAGRQGVARRYWRLPIPPRLPFDSDPGELAAELRRLLDQAVRRRLPAHGPGTAEMSGGLDSTPIAVLAARALRAEGRRLYGYSMQEARGATDLPIIDEAPDVAEVAAGEPNLEVVPVPMPGFFKLLRDGYEIDDFDASAVDEPVNCLLRHAASLGASVMFSGWGGDEIVTHVGRGAFAELFWAGRWGSLRRHLAERSRRMGGTVRGRFVWSVLLQSLPFGPRHWLLRRLGKDDSIGTVMTKPLPFLPHRHQGHVARSPIIDGPDSRRNKRGYAESWWMQKRLEIHAQQGARHGLAYVFPMLDLDLIAYAMRVPGIFYSRTSGDRSMIRFATKGILPDTVRFRVDKLMAYPLESLRLAEDRPMVLERLPGLAASPLVAEFVNVDALRHRLDELPRPEEARAETIAAAERGEQPVLDDGGYETALRLAMILAEHEGSLRLPDEPGGDGC